MWKIETFVTQFFRENQFWWMKNVRKIQFGEILDPLNYSFNEFVQILKARNLLTSKLRTSKCVKNQNSNF